MTDQLYKVREGAPYSERTIPVAEIFGPTIQGEGLLAGLPTYFVRVGGCDYKCAWCDTEHAVLPEQVKLLERKSVGEIATDLTQWVIDHPGPDWLAISGGNPGLYDMGQLVTYWQGSGQWSTQRRVTVETQGSRWQPWFNFVNCLTVSPKPPSSGINAMTSEQTIYRFLEASTYDEYSAYVHLNDRSLPPDYYNMVLKCIVFDEADYTFAQNLHRRYPLMPFYLSTGTAMGGLTGKWVPPAIPDIDYDRFAQQRDHPDLQWSPKVYVDTVDNLLLRYRWLAERAMNDPWMADVKVGVQQHCLLWGITTRGV